MIIQNVVKQAMNVFEQNMIDLANQSNTKELTADLALEVSSVLQSALSLAGQTAYQTFIESYDLQEPVLKINGQLLRWKMKSSKQFLTPFGTIEITRSLYQADQGGRTYCSLDDFWGMPDEFATEDIREAVAFSMAHLTADETEQLFGKCAWFQPSATAIKNMANEIGDVVETHGDALISAVQQSDAIPPETEVLVASMDGVNVLLREPGIPQGRPAQRPGLKASSSPNTAFKNAMTGAISCYRIASDSEERPQRLQSRYTARMHQERAVTFKAHFEQELLSAEAKLSADVIKIFLCDGRRSIWSYVAENPLYEGYEPLIDFYHTADHLSKAGEALFGKSSQKSTAWYDRYRKKASG